MHENSSALVELAFALSPARVNYTNIIEEPIN